MENLSDRFTRMIAQDEGISPEEVTTQYIHEQRKKNIYPNTRYEAPLGLMSFTRNELDEIERIVDELMALV